MEAKVFYQGVEFLVDFDYQPSEPAIYYDSNGEGHPFIPEHISINKITTNEDLTEFLSDELQYFRDEVMEHLNIK